LLSPARIRNIPPFMTDLVPEKESPGFDLITWFEVNKRAVVLGLAFIIVAIAGSIIWRSERQARLEAASGALLAVTTAHKQAVPLPELEKVIQAHPKSAAAAQASLLAGKELFQQGKYADARARFENVISLTDSEDVVASAQYGLAACLDAEGKIPEALTAYLKVMDYPGAKHLNGLARLTIAGIYESQGKSKEALAMYDAILRTPGSATAQEASQLRAGLLRLHPELTPAATNSIPTTAPTIIPAPAK